MSAPETTSKGRPNSLSESAPGAADDSSRIFASFEALEAAHGPHTLRFKKQFAAAALAVVGLGAVGAWQWERAQDRAYPVTGVVGGNLAGAATAGASHTMIVAQRTPKDAVTPAHGAHEDGQGPAAKSQAAVNVAGDTPASSPNVPGIEPLPRHLANGTMSNGTVADSAVGNSTVGNSTVANGTMSNGIVANGPVANGPVANGTIANGTVANGTVADGTVANGTVANGTVANGTVAKGTVAGATRASGGVPDSGLTAAGKRADARAERDSAKRRRAEKLAAARTKPYRLYASKKSRSGAQSAPHSEHVVSLAAQVEECGKSNFFQEQICRWHVCSGHWGKDPACPSARNAEQFR